MLECILSPWGNPYFCGADHALIQKKEQNNFGVTFKVWEHSLITSDFRVGVGPKWLPKIGRYKVKIFGHGRKVGRSKIIENCQMSFINGRSLVHSSISGIIPIYGNSFVAASHSFWPKVHLRGFALVNHPVIFTIWRAPLPLSKGFSVIYYLWSLTDCLHIGVFSSLLPWEASEVLGSKIYGHLWKYLFFKRLTYLIIDLVYITTLWL